MQPWSVLKTISLFLVAAVLGCGGGSSSSNTVAQVNLNPPIISMQAGQVSHLSVIALNSTNTPVTTTFTFNSSNPKLVTIAPSGDVCAGVWDSLFVTCNGNDAAGNPLVGTATVTATAAGITSAPVQVSVHPSVTSVTVDPVSGCFSQKQTHQFTAHAFHNGTEITNQVGGFTWNTTNGSVVLVDTNGLATAQGFGQAGIIASAGSVSSPTVNFRSCMPVDIRLHIPNDTATSVTLNLTGTQTVQVDITDENGTNVSGATGLTLISNNTSVATISGPATSATITAQSFGGAGIIAVCAPPNCGSGVNQPLYSNLFSVTVPGTSPPTFVYVASTDPATISTVIPVDTSKTPPVAGTPIPLPGHPNSLVFPTSGSRLWVGTDAGLVAIDPLTNAASVVAPEAVGVVLAVSPDGNRAVVSNAPIQPDVLQHRLRVFDAGASSLQTFIVHNVVAAAFDPDGVKAFMGATDGNVYVFSPVLTFQNVPSAGSFKSATVLSSGGLALFANNTGLSTFNICDNSPGPAVGTNSAPQLVGSILNSNQVVAIDSTGVNFETINVAPPASGFCPINASSSNQFFNFNAGAITARQLIIASNGSHIVVLPAGRNFMLGAIPGQGSGIIPLGAGATEALGGSMTLDGSTLWVGVNPDHTLHRINLNTLADEFQMQPNVDGGGSTPDLVAVKPK